MKSLCINPFILGRLLTEGQQIKNNKPKQTKNQAKYPPDPTGQFLSPSFQK